ncbi:MAG: porin family protein, partial [Treponema sp.]|nr:porin family protein [Treponema sp.]
MMKSMKSIMGLMAVAGMLMFPVKAIAADGQLGIYVAPKVIYGLTYMKDFKYRQSNNDNDNVGNKWDSAFGGSLAAGYDFSKKLNIPLRGELEYTVFTKAEAEGEKWGSRYEQSNNIQTLFANVYYDINTGTKFTPYVGAGMGAGFIRTKGYGDWGWATFDTGSKTVTNFAWNVGLGLGYQITNNVTLDVGYRFADLGKVQTNWNTDYAYPCRMEIKRIYQHQFSMGAR